MLNAVKLRSAVKQMGIGERREREQEQLRQKILDAASEMFAAEGYRSVSMRKIAERIEYSPTTIYLYFKDKDDLLKQICEETFARLGQELNRIEKKYGRTFEGLRRGLKTYVEFGLKHPKQYEVTFMLPVVNKLDQKDYPYVGSMGQRAFEYLRSQVTECVKNGEINKTDVDATSQALWAGIHGVTSLQIAHCGFPFVEPDKLIDKTIELLLDGLRA